MTTRERAVAVDTTLAGLYEERWSAADRLAQTINGIHYAVRDRQTGRNRWAMTSDEAVAALRAKVESPDWDPNRKVRESQLADVDKYRAAIATADEAIRPLSREYANDPWPRFFLVTNAGGHIHKDMACSTCHPTTRYGWLPDLSGLTEADAVAAQGPRLCSVCYPSAPVEWTLGLPSTSEKCPGSGNAPIRDGRSRYARYGQCATCGKTVALTSAGFTRAHKPAKEV